MRARFLSSVVCEIALGMLIAAGSITAGPAQAAPTNPSTTTSIQAANIQQVEPARYCKGTAADKAACEMILAEVRTQYGVEILVRGMNVDPAAEGYAFDEYGLEWTLNRAKALRQQVEQVAGYFGGIDRFKQAFDMTTGDGGATEYPLTFALVDGKGDFALAYWITGKKRIHLTTIFWLTPGVVVHEMGHAWADLNDLEDTFLTAVGGSYAQDGKYTWDSKFGPPVTRYGETDHREDLAEAFKVCVTTPSDLEPSTRRAFIESNVHPMQ